VASSPTVYFSRVCTDVNDLRQLLTPSLGTLTALDLINNTCGSDVKELVLPYVEIHIAECAFHNEKKNEKEMLNIIEKEM